MDIGFSQPTIRSGKKRGRGTERKKMAVVVSKTESDCPLFLRFQMIPDVTTASLQAVINESVKTGSTIECDGLKSYPGLENVSINASNYETGDLKWVHVAIGNFKAFLLDHTRKLWRLPAIPERVLLPLQP